MNSDPIVPSSVGHSPRQAPARRSVTQVESLRGRNIEYRPSQGCNESRNGIRGPGGAIHALANRGLLILLLLAAGAALKFQLDRRSLGAARPVEESSPPPARSAIGITSCNQALAWNTYRAIDSGGCASGAAAGDGLGAEAIRLFSLILK